MNRLHVSLASLAILATLALHPASANSYSSQQGGIGSTGYYSSVAWASAGVNACQNLSPAAPLACSGAGAGIIFDVSGLDSSDLFVVGTCTVDDTAAIVQNDFTVVCSTDRDDDGRYTNVDGLSSSVDGFDDDYVVGTAKGVTSVTVSLCFARDGSNAGADWDDIHVFIESQDNGQPSEGSFTASLSLTTASSCGTGANVSAHTTGDFEETENPAPLPPTTAGGWACAGA